MSGLPIASPNAECVKNECSETALLIPFGNVWNDYILGHVELCGKCSISISLCITDACHTHAC